MDKVKWRRFISTLSTNEIERHSGDILSFAKEYQQMITEELNSRKAYGNAESSADNPEFDSFFSDDSHVHSAGGEDCYESSGNDFPEMDSDETGLDFYTITKIQEAVDSYGEEKIQKRIEELNEILKSDLTGIARAVALFEKELCVCKSGESEGAETGQPDENDVCKLCGTSMRYSAAFCTKCGAKR